jgi:hypothetical protein
MKLTKGERVVFAGAPLFSGMILIVTGWYSALVNPRLPQGMIMIGAGLVCVSLYCVAALLIKLIEK